MMVFDKRPAVLVCLNILCTSRVTHLLQTADRPSLSHLRSVNAVHPPVNTNMRSSQNDVGAHLRCSIWVKVEMAGGTELSTYAKQLVVGQIPLLTTGFEAYKPRNRLIRLIVCVQHKLFSFR